MRLTKLKLAGFKSFVDPTTIALPGQLVGVVGPNGCGKSNVMDAVRWVLGESRASELRGESMQDVIFNGSSNRKPVARAAVELVFDNAQGRASGQWSQYAELSVKRILTRTGQSEYHINNLQVRRKDITDLFLGTGLGPRAYAIIGQGMISRIIEARPDELRVFLEEAAGVTRYKERRRETEHRLADTRDNLTRVEDIRVELASQMERLEAQAVVARQYREFNSQLTHKQQLLWLLRRCEAEAEQQRLESEIAQAVLEGEAQTAALRHIEAHLEHSREQHFLLNEQVHQTQGAMFTANAEVARLEAEMRHRREARQQLEARQSQLQQDQQQWQAQAHKAEVDTRRWQDLAVLADARVEEAALRLEAFNERLPLAEERLVDAQSGLSQLRGAMAQAEQKLRIEETHQTNTQRSIANMAVRRARLEQELQALVVPEREGLGVRAAEQEMLQALLSEAADALQAAQQALPELEAERREILAAVQAAQRERAQCEARLSALEQLQQRVQASGRSAEWLQRHGLAGRPPLWKGVQITPGWEAAFEAVLRERLGAVPAEPADLVGWLSDRPAAKLAVIFACEPGREAAAHAGAEDALMHQVQCDDAAIRGALQHWLSGVRTERSAAAAVARRETLAPGECFVCPAGDVVHASGATLFAPEAAEHGLLERQREIETLQDALQVHEALVETAQAQLAAVETRLESARETVRASRESVTTQQARVHALQVETLKLTQIIERYEERREQLELALADLLLEEETERERLFGADEVIAARREEFDAYQDQLPVAKARHEEAERSLRDARAEVAQAEREWREAQFSQRECAGKLTEFARVTEMAEQQLQRIVTELLAQEDALLRQTADDLEPGLQLALDQRVASEQRLAAARNDLEAATTALREAEEQRLRIEHGLGPLRERLGELRLKAQAQTLNVEQFARLLTEAEANVALLEQDLGGARASTLQGQMSSLQKAVEALGAVNLAALDELETARQRKGFLDAQAEDLTEAMATLESAIRRIDKETRDLLQATFDAVGRSFGQLFPELFGGGEARLIMTGDEILDAGVQVMAQPPGKRNSTIQLLSGGEKALTAIALVFAMFSLNPAPFCLLDEVDAPLDDTNTERFCAMVKKMSLQTQFLFISHNKIAMEMAEQLVGVTMQESGVSRIVEVDVEEALRMREQVSA